MKKGSDWLRSQSEGKKRERGVSILDLATLPPNQRKIMRILLRKIEMTHPDLCETVEAMPEAGRMSMDELDEALEELSKQGWLTRTDDQDIVYKVNFHRKAASRLSQNIWSALESKNKNPGKLKNSDSES